MAGNSRKKGNKIFLLIMAVLLIAVIALGMYFYFCVLGTDTPETDTAVTSSDPLYIDYIDVGQGDCELITQGDTAILIDGGEAENAETVAAQLKSRNVDTVDCYILTHPHSDHIGASAEIMSLVTVDTVFSTTLSDDSVPTTKTYEKLVDAIDEYAKDYVEVEAGQTYTFGNIKMDILAPVEVSDELNDMSICCKITYGTFTALFCGDATKTVEKQILESGADVSADVFKVSHHGSSTSNSEDFISAISPQLAVISCGLDNSYGHPHQETLDTLNKLGIDYLRTDEKGTITVSSDGTDFSVTTEK